MAVGFDPNDDRPHLTIDQVADRWAVDKRVVYKLINDGHLVAVKIGRDWRIAPSAVNEYEVANTSVPGRRRRQPADGEVLSVASVDDPEPMAGDDP
ncbi:hypothetical protein GCM10023258_39910 [Terrabacter aeriphilus]|uniref:Helix-turn-helix domain-containing protein n=1 Tax=Terrabacter aeriphilus TaxID=515662 RepID=A0ABP9JR84_9MICO